MNHNYCIILAGGNGSRFWPLSKKNKPKQFIDFFGTGRTLLQQTYERFCKIVPKEHIYVTTNRMYVGLIKEQLPELPEEHILPEPAPRNTAPCVAWASSHIKSKDNEANIVVTPCDQLIMKENEFIEDIKAGIEFVAKSHNILTFGIKPTRAETGYGYIQANDEAIANEGKIMKVKAFTEKPEQEFAQIFYESGEFYWNTGLFLWNVETIFDAFKSLMPDLATDLAIGEDTSVTHDLEKRIIEKNYSSCPNLPFDYGILEKADNVYIMTCDFGWADLGTWENYYESMQKDDNANALRRGTNAIIHNGKGNIVCTENNKVVVMSGIDNCVVAENGNVILVCKKDDVKDIRKFVNETQVTFGDEFI